MFINLFQLFLFFCICIPAYGMNKELSLIADSTPSDDIAYDIMMQYVSKVRREKPQPISERDMYHGLIRNYTAKGNSEKAIELCEKIEHKIPYDTSILTPDHKKKCDNILAIMENSALNGNNRAQNLITKRSLESCTPFLYKNHQDEITYALNYFTFLLNLTEKKIPIITPNPAKDKIMQMIEHGYPELQVILRACRCLQATEGQKQITDHLFLGQACPNSPLIELTCKYLLEKIDTQTFVTTLKAQKKIPHITDELKKIACMPICPKIIEALKKALLKTDSSLTPDIDYFLAILFEKQNDIVQANNFYTKVIESKSSYSKHQTTITSAIKARLASIETISNEDIIYFSKKFENIYAQLEKIEKVDPKVSYSIGLLTHALLNTIQNMSIIDKTNILFNGLEHLIYAQDNHTWSKKIVKKITTLCFEFEISLSDIYQGKNDSVTALKHLENGIKHHAQNSTNRCDNDIINILIEAQKQDIVAYDHYAPYILALLNYRYNAQAQQYNDKQKNYSALRDFAHSDLAARLLSYCECLYKEKESVNNTTSYLLALIYKNKGDNNKAYDYIATVSLPTPKEMLFDKAAMYIKVEKPLSLIELKNIFKLFIKNKIPLKHEQEVISSLVTSEKDLFTLPENQTLALNLITKLAQSIDTLNTAIEVAFHVTKNMISTKNNDPLLTQWLEKLYSCQLYTPILDHKPLYYSADTNNKIVLLLMAQGSAYGNETILSYLTKAELSPENNATIRYDKAKFLLDNTNDPHLINYALDLFEENIKDVIAENEKPLKELSLIALSEAYFNYNDSPKRHIFLQKQIPFDANKALMYLNLTSNDNIRALVHRASISAGTSKFITNPTLKEKYSNIQDAINYTTTLITIDSKNAIDYASLLMSLYGKLNNHTKTLEYIDFMLCAKDLTNTTGVTREKLLRKKIEILSSCNPDDTAYDQILDCFKQLFTFENVDLINDCDITPILKKRTREIISQHNLSQQAVAWCCFIANAEITYYENKPNQTTQDQKDLAGYLRIAAKMGDLDAQLYILPYATLQIQQELEESLTSDYLVDAMTYTYEALHNPKALQNKVEMISSVITLLVMLAEQGDGLAYYILCDYFQNDANQLEKIMLAFSKAKNKCLYLEINDTSDITTRCSALIEKICTSCRETLFVYAARYIKHDNKKKSLIDAIATFTLGFMYHYSNDNALLIAGSCYLQSVLINIIDNKNKLHECLDSVQIILANTYYKSATIRGTNDVKTINFKLLYKSIQHGWCPAAELLARIWIQQHKDGKTDIIIQEDDFAPLLTHNITVNYACNSKTLELFNTYQEIKSKHHSKNKKPCTLDANGKIIKISEQNIMDISPYAQKEDWIYHQNYEEKSSFYNKAMQLQQTNREEFNRLLIQAIKKEQHANACIMLALSNLTADFTQRNYKLAEKYLKLSLTYGLIPKATNKNIKQFHNAHFSSILSYYVLSLMSSEHQPLIAKTLLSIIKNALETSGIDIEKYNEIFKKTTNLDLKWKKNPEQQYKNDSEIIISASDRDEIFKQRLTEEMKRLKDFSDKLPINRNILLHVIPEKSSDLFYAKLQPDKPKQDTKTLQFLEYGAKQNNPIALLALAFHHLAEKQDTEKYVKSIQFLNQALLHGLTEKQFYDYNLLTGLCFYISSLDKHAQILKKSILSSIIKTLEEKEIDLSEFSEIYQKITGKTLPATSQLSLNNLLIAPLNSDNVALATLIQPLNPNYPECAQNQNGAIKHKKNKKKQSQNVTKK